MKPVGYEEAVLGNVMHFTEVMGCWANFRNGVDLQYFGKQLGTSGIQTFLPTVSQISSVVKKKKKTNFSYHI